MKTYVNRAALRKEHFRSAGVSLLSYIVHPIKKEGLYRGKIYDGENLIDQFSINCHGEAKDRQLDIDMADFDFNRDADKGRRSYEIVPEGFLLLYDSKKDCNLRVQVERLTERENIPEFDTETLQKEDHYAVTLLRPGRYVGQNKGSRGKLAVEVVYPEPATGARKPIVPPVRVRIDGRGFSPNEVKVQPGQGLVFEIATSTQLELKLEEGAARPADTARERSELNRDQKSRKTRKRYRWNNPRYSDAG